MTAQEAIKRAKAYTDKTGKNAFVYRTGTGYDWCTDWAYRHGTSQIVDPSDVWFSTFEGDYAER